MKSDPEDTQGTMSDFGSKRPLSAQAGVSGVYDPDSTNGGFAGRRGRGRRDTLFP